MPGSTKYMVQRNKIVDCDLESRKTKLCDKKGKNEPSNRLFVERVGPSLQERQACGKILMKLFRCIQQTVEIVLLAGG